jgi:hypothetical protein
MRQRIKDWRAWAACVLVAMIALVALAVDTDSDGMSDDYENLFGLSPTNAADASLDYDGDGVTNSQEATLSTDPWEADTDLDGFGDGQDSNAVSRLVVRWGNGDYCNGEGGYEYTGPAWWVSATARGGEWATNPVSWHVAATDTNASTGLEIVVNRGVLTNDAVLALDFLDSTNGSLYVSLLESATASVLVTDVCGNVMGGTGGWTRVLVDIPLADHPSADQVLIWRHEGAVSVSTNTLYVDQDHDGLDQEQEAQLGTSDLSADSDGDGLGDYAEVFTHSTNPAVADTDGDGMPDGWEVQHGLDPLNASDATGDPDADGTGNLEEYLQGRNPTKGVSPDSGQVVRLKILTPLEP